MTFFELRKSGSSLALAIALATGSALIATAAFPSEAQAQRKKDEEEQEQENDGGGYSEAFVAAYQPINEGLKAEGADAASFKPQLLDLIRLANSKDEMIAAGGLIFNTAIGLNDRSMQLRGMELMLASGKVPAGQVGRYNFIAYQIANGQSDYPKARRYLQGAIDNNFTTEQISDSDLQIAMAENFFSANELVEGLAFLDGAIKARKSAGLEIEERWYRRGLSVAYNNQVVPQVYDVVTQWIVDYPSPGNWRDAVNLARNLNEFSDPEMLDLLRLARVNDAMRDRLEYLLYVEAADARRLPKEVKDVIEQAYASDAVSRDNIFLADSLEVANDRIESDLADLPSLEADASAPDAGLRTVVAAGRAFLSYGEFEKAARFFEMALTMPEVDRAEALHRLGMAQVGLGQYDAARTSFAQVEGSRAPIAQLWSAYAEHRINTAATTAVAPTAPATADTVETTS